MRAKKPEIKQKRLKLFLYGPAGIGKTLAAIQFPNAYIIDAERGTEEYSETIIKAGSDVFSSHNPNEIREELHELLTTKHEYKTLIIDPMTMIYNSTQEKWNRIFEKYADNEKAKEVQDYGQRYWGKVKSEFKSLERMILALDMNVIVTAHQKDMYGPGMQKIGVTYDSMKGDEYLYDHIFQLARKGDKRVAIKIKERAEIGKEKFPAEFEWSYKNFCDFYGKDILERKANPIAMALPDQVEKLNRLLTVVSIDDETQNRWLTAANCNTFADMTADAIGKCIDYCEKRVKDVTK